MVKFTNNIVPKRAQTTKCQMKKYRMFKALLIQPLKLTLTAVATVVTYMSGDLVQVNSKR